MIFVIFLEIIILFPFHLRFSGWTKEVKICFYQVEEVEAVLANTKQILSQFLRKSRILYTEQHFGGEMSLFPNLFLGLVHFILQLGVTNSCLP